MKKNISFTEETIQKLFGHEAAEDEDESRLQEYYFKSNIYKQVTANLSLRILVGHKGTGKSALFKMAMHEDISQGKLPILIQPNDIVDISIDDSNFLKKIQIWTEGLLEIIFNKILVHFEIYDNRVDNNSYKKNPKNFLKFLVNYLNNVNTDNEKTLSSILNFLENPSINVYVDDLDRGWEGRKEDTNKISALLNAVRDISNSNKHLNFKIALRTDVYYLVRTSDESTDKTEGSVVWLAWKNHEIFILLIKRIETFFGRNINEDELLNAHQNQKFLAQKYLKPIIEDYFTGKGKWENAPMYRILMSLIRKRPRDLVKLCTLAAKMAYSRGSSIIQTEDFKSIFEEYSQGRIQDTVNEFKSELPTIQNLLMNMKPNRRERTTQEGYVYTTAELLEKIKNISESSRFVWTNGKSAEPKELAAFMYKINFLTARKETSSGIIRKYFEENRYLSSQFSDFGFSWEIHPAYRWALQPDTIHDIFQNLDLSIDDNE